MGGQTIEGMIMNGGLSESEALSNEESTEGPRAKDSGSVKVEGKVRSPLRLRKVEPWPEPVDGKALLDKLAALLSGPALGGAAKGERTDGDPAGGPAASVRCATADDLDWREFGQRVPGGGFEGSVPAVSFEGGTGGAGGGCAGGATAAAGGAGS